jgi:hypothetical protein
LPARGKNEEDRLKLPLVYSGMPLMTLEALPPDMDNVADFCPGIVDIAYCSVRLNDVNEIERAVETDLIRLGLFYYVFIEA